MRILTLSDLFPPHVIGGYEVACRNVVAGLRDRGHVVEVLASHAPIATPDDPPWLHRVMALSGFDPVPPHSAEQYQAACSHYPNTAALLAHLRRFRPDIVYAWNLWGIGGLALLDLIDQLGIPWLLHLMDKVPSYLLTDIAPIVAALFAKNDRSLFTRARAIAMSEHLLSEIAETSGINFETAPTIIPGWVDARRVVPHTKYLEGGQLRLTAAGSLGLHKGTDIIIDACSRLLADGYSTFHVDIYGFGVAEPWVSRAVQCGVAKHVTFLGPRTQHEMMALLTQYDAFLFPTQKSRALRLRTRRSSGVRRCANHNAQCGLRGALRRRRSRAQD